MEESRLSVLSDILETKRQPMILANATGSTGCSRQTDVDVVSASSDDRGHDVTGEQNSASVASEKAMSLEKNLRQHGLKLLVCAALVALRFRRIGFHQTVNAADPQRRKWFRRERRSATDRSLRSEDSRSGHRAL